MKNTKKHAYSHSSLLCHCSIDEKPIHCTPMQEQCVNIVHMRLARVHQLSTRFPLCLSSMSEATHNPPPPPHQRIIIMPVVCCIVAFRAARNTIKPNTTTRATVEVLMCNAAALGLHSGWLAGAFAKRVFVKMSPVLACATMRRAHIVNMEQNKSHFG